MDKILTVSCKSSHTIETQRKKELEASHPLGITGLIAIFTGNSFVHLWTPTSLPLTTDYELFFKPSLFFKMTQLTLSHIVLLPVV